MTATKTELLAEYRAMLPTMYDWALNEALLDQFALRVRNARYARKLYHGNSLVASRCNAHGAS